MSLIDRLAGLRDPENPEALERIAVDYFWAHLYELAQGEVTETAIVSRFSLDAAEEVELSWLVEKYNAQPNAETRAKFVELIRVIFIMSEGDAPGYTTNADIVARINGI